MHVTWASSEHASGLVVDVVLLACSHAHLPPHAAQVPSFNSDGGSGVQTGLLVVVTTCYLTSSFLFAVLGVVIWVGHRRGKLLNNYVSFENEPEGDGEADH